MVEIIAPIVNFSAVVIILWYFGRKPITAFLVNRSQTVESAISEAELEAGEADKVLTEWAGKWNGSEAHVQELREEARKRMELFREQSMESAKIESERIEKETQLVGQSEFSKASAELRKEIGIQSVDLAREYVKGHLSERDRQKLVSEYVEILGNGATN